MKTLSASAVKEIIFPVFSSGRNKLTRPGNDYSWPDFMFELSPGEFESLRSQIVTSNKRGGTRYAPFAFTEQGVAMLSSVLGSEIAIEVNIGIIRAFVAMRQLLLAPPEDKVEKLHYEMKELRQYIEESFADYNDIHEDTRMQIELINQVLAELQVKGKLPKERPRIGFVK